MTTEKDKKNTKIDSNFIPLSEASKRSGYTPEHLNLLSRQKKLKAEKIGRNWYTTEEWFEEFLLSVAEKKNKAENGNQAVSEKERKKSTEEIIPSEDAPQSEIGEINFIAENKKTEKLSQGADSKSAWLPMLAGVSSMAIMVPLIFLTVYFVKNFFTYQAQEKNKLASIEASPAGEILNDTSLVGEINSTPNIITGIVEGDTTTSSEEAAKKSGIILSSENFKASQVNLGGGIVLTDAEDNQPMEITDIKSESFVTSKNSSSGNSTEETKLVISWKTNKLAMSELDYSKNNGQDPKAIKEQSFGFNHAVVLTQIDPRTSYVYQIKGKDHWGNVVSSDYYGIFTSSKPVSVFDLITKQINEIFGWALKK